MLFDRPSTGATGMDAAGPTFFISSYPPVKFEKTASAEVDLIEASINVFQSTSSGGEDAGGRHHAPGTARTSTDSRSQPRARTGDTRRG